MDNNFEQNNGQGPYQDPNQVPYQGPYQDPNQVPYQGPYQDPNQIPYQDPYQDPYQMPYQDPMQMQYQQMQYQQMQQQEMENIKRANRLCIISVALAALGCGVIPGINILLSVPSFYNSGVFGSYILSSLGWLCNLAALVLMIVARVRYPRNTFAKVLMWIYIVAIILSVIGMIILFATCVWFLSQCVGY